MDLTSLGHTSDLGRIVLFGDQGRSFPGVKETGGFARTEERTKARTRRAQSGIVRCGRASAGARACGCLRHELSFFITAASQEPPPSQQRSEGTTTTPIPSEMAGTVLAI